MSLEDRIDGALLRSAADAADLIREALVAGLNPTAIAEAFLATHPKEVTPAAARAWARHNVRFNPAPLEAALRQIYGTGWTLGVDSARSHLAQRTFKKAAAPNLNDYVGFDWNNWKPGNHPGEYLVRPPGGLRTLLERRGQAISSIASTNYDRVGTILADALRGGDTAASVAREFITSNIDRLAADPARALTIATTEMARAMMVASVDQYGEFGVEQVEWLGMDPCEEICAPLDGQRVPLGQAFDSGDTEPPAHPNCRCTLVPVVDDGADLPVVPLEDGGDFVDSEMEVFSGASHAINDVVATDSGAAHPLRATATMQQRDALDEWQSQRYEIFNRRVRSGKELGAYDQRTKDGLLSLIEQTPPLTESKTVYRGFNGYWAEQMYGLEVGQTFTDEGFVALSQDRNIASSFARGNANRLLIEAEMPSGTRAFSVDAFRGVVDPQPGMSEQEFILPPNSKFEVIAPVDPEAYIPVLKVRVVS